MSQKTAHREMDCTECYRYIADGDPVWYLDTNPYCLGCAQKLGIECPKCHGSKRPDYKQCYNCAMEMRGQQRGERGKSGVRIKLGEKK